MPTTAIGLDLGSSHVRAAEVRFARGRSAAAQPPVLTRYAEVPLPAGAVRDGEVADPAAVTAALRQLWSQGRFSSKDVNIGVGNQRVVVRELELPWMPLPELRASLPYQVQDLVPMPVEDALLDIYPTGDHQGPQGRMVRGMLVAATRETVRSNVSAVQAAGLRPRMVDLNPFAVLRALTRGEHAARTVALVEIGARITQVVVVAHGTPRFVRMLPSGGQNVTDAVAAALGMEPAQAESLKRTVGIGAEVRPEHEAAGEAISAVVRPLMEAVRNTFVYYSSNNPGAGIDVAVLSGGGSQLPGLDRFLETTSRLAVVAADPLGSVKVARERTLRHVARHAPVLATPIGLAHGVAS